MNIVQRDIGLEVVIWSKIGLYMAFGWNCYLAYRDMNFQ
jgi:hypothetical protein